MEINRGPSLPSEMHSQVKCQCVQGHKGGGLLPGHCSVSQEHSPSSVPEGGPPLGTPVSARMALCIHLLSFPFSLFLSCWSFCSWCCFSSSCFLAVPLQLALMLQQLLLMLHRQHLLLLLQAGKGKTKKVSTLPQRKGENRHAGKSAEADHIPAPSTARHLHAVRKRVQASDPGRRGGMAAQSHMHQSTFHILKLKRKTSKFAGQRIHMDINIILQFGYTFLKMTQKNEWNVITTLGNCLAFLIKSNTCLRWDPVIPLRDIYPRDWKLFVYRKTSTRMHTTALLQQPKVDMTQTSFNRWTQKAWSIYTADAWKNMDELQNKENKQI